MSPQIWATAPQRTILGVFGCGWAGRPSNTSLNRQPILVLARGTVARGD